MKEPINERYNQDSWIRFMLLGDAPHGKTLEETLRFDAIQFDTEHDFIQWLFPNRAASRVNPEAPCLSDLHVEAFGALPSLRTAVAVSLRYFLGFLGIERKEGCFVRGANFATGSRFWLTRIDHNHLRITRAMTFLVEIGHPASAIQFLEFLVRELQQAGLEHIESVGYWRDTCASSKLHSNADGFMRQT